VTKPQNLPCFLFFLPRDARYCYRKSSIRLSVALVYRGHRPIGWTSSKLITRIISLGLRSSEPQNRQFSPEGTPLKFRWNRGGVDLFRKPAISLKRDKIGPRLMTNRQSHTRFRLVPKSTTLDDLEGPLRIVSKHVRLSEPTTNI